MSQMLRLNSSNLGPDTAQLVRGQNAGLGEMGEKLSPPLFPQQMGSIIPL